MVLKFLKLKVNLKARPFGRKVQDLSATAVVVVSEIYFFFLTLSDTFCYLQIQPCRI